MGALQDVVFQVVQEHDKWKGLVVVPKGLATGGESEVSGAGAQSSGAHHGGGQRGAVLSRVQK